MSTRSSRTPHARTDQLKVIARDFRPLLRRLEQLEREYNPDKVELHFEAVPKVDATLFQQICVLAEEGLEAVRRHRAHFLTHDLYDDGMFWYKLCLLISGAARGSRVASNVPIPRALVNRLAVIVTDLSEYTAWGGDMTKRNYEALGDLLLAFESESLRSRVLSRGTRLGSPDVARFVMNTMKRVDRIKACMDEE